MKTKFQFLFCTMFVTSLAIIWIVKINYNIT